MTYQVLARKWRPQDFASLVGQEPIVTSLKNALTEGRIAQAYVFSGIRGVGKTTAARILSKALNCERARGSKERPGVDPCNDCPSCREITGGSDVINVREIDAATYSKVEQVRELTESLRLGASRSDRYKVVIMDEVHRLSRQAFDALLKIVEEPPPRLVFIFATTELDAVPATILSRCQEFQFRRVPSPVLATHLGKIARSESIEVSEAALRMIARAGEGSVRDSVALLDQLATFGGGTISDQDANRLLGGLDADIFRRLLAAILGTDHAVITSVVSEIEENGWDPHHVYSQFLSYVRDALHLALGGAPETIDLPLEEAQALGEVAGSTSYESLLQLAQLLLGEELLVKRSEFALLALEITWLRAAELPKITRVADILSGRAAVKVPDLATGGVAAAPQPPAKVTTARPKPPADSAPRPAADLDEGSPAPVGSSEAIQKFRSSLAGRPALSARFHDVGLQFDNGTLRIQAGDAASELRKAIDRKANRDFLVDALQSVWGDGTTYDIRDGETAAADEPDSPSPEPEPPRQEAPRQEAPRQEAPATPPSDRRPSADDELKARFQDHPAVKAVLDVFPGDFEVRRSDR